MLPEAPTPAYRRSRWAATALGATTAALFYAAATVRLDAQGPYYDELHQATGAFLWRGARQRFFVALEAHGVPLLNMWYSGAIKTALYGLYLRWTGAPFTVESWRLAGVLLAIGGMVGFLLLAAGRLPTAGLALVAALLVTDTSVLLMSRFDWGPVALGLALRMLLLAAWLRAATSDRPAAPMFAVGLLVSLSVFEKLSGVVLVVPLAVLVLSAPALRSRRSLAATAAGLLVGGLPLLWVNAISLRREHRLVSLGLGLAPPERTLRTFFEHLWNYATLAQGEAVRSITLDLPTRPAARLGEAAALLALLFVIALAARSSPSPWARRSLALAIAWAGVGAALFFLPAPTWAHHWVIGTPFQYGAVAAGAIALAEDLRARVPWARVRLATFAVTLVALAVLRGVGMTETERGLRDGRTARNYHHDFTSIGELAAAAGEDTVFVASDWGVATQIFCFGNGRSDHVFEPFWQYRGPQDLERIAAGRRVLYVVRVEPPFAFKPDVTRLIERDVQALPGWREAELEAPFARLATLRIRKYVLGGTP